MKKGNRKFYINFEEKLYPLKKWIRENHQILTGFSFNENDNSITMESKLEKIGWTSFYDENNNWQVLSMFENVKGFKNENISNKEFETQDRTYDLKKVENLFVFNDEEFMISVFNSFKENFSKRFNHISILNLGEDSLRYDFFDALKLNHNLETYQIQLEFPISSKAYKSNLHEKSKRKENPQIDLYSPYSPIPISIEFGMFKRNSNLNGSVKKTGNFFKMINDMVRLSMNNKYADVNLSSYFICLADEMMLGYKMKKSNCPTFIFPDSEYQFSYNELNNWMNNYKSAKSELDSRFVETANNVSLKIKAELVYNQKIDNLNSISDNNLGTNLIVYKITSN